MKITANFIRSHSFLLSFLFVFSYQINSQIILDTVKHIQVGPGMYYTKYNVNSVPWSIDVFEADMTNEYFSVETVKAYELLAGGREKTSSMSARRNYLDHWSVCAINGDFFNLSTGMPNNIQVENGEVLRNERADWPTVGFNSRNEVSFSNTYLKSSLIVKDTLLFVNSINTTKSDNQIVFYNSFYDKTTGTTTNGFEAVVSPLEAWFANDTIYCIVDSITPEGNNSNITPGSIVISASGVIAAYLWKNIAVKDTVKIINNISPSVNKLKEMMGGHPIIIKDGYSTSMDPNDSFVYTRHPRTAVGVNIDTTKLFFVTVDGRQSASLGMNLFELADLMLQLGVYQGINLDGGGSTTMVIRNEVVNSPSDVSGERPVSNAILVISSAPSDTLSYLNVFPKSSEIFLGKQIQFSVSATDKFYNPSFINPYHVKYMLSDSSKGNITSTGLFTAKNHPGECYVIVSYGNLIDSAKVIVKGVGKIVLSPDEIVTDNSRIVVFTAKVYDTQDLVQEVLPQNITWKVSDTTVGSIDIVGQFQGKQNGLTNVVSSYLDKYDTSIVRVEIGNGTVVIDSIESNSNWEYSTENMDSSLTKVYFVPSPSTIGDSSLKLEYSFTYLTSQFNWVYLNTNTEIFGIPDSIMLDVFSDGASHRIFFDVVDNDQKQFRISSHKFANNANNFETIRGRIVSSSNVIFPLTLKRISIVLGSSQVDNNVYNGAIYFDKLKVKYPIQTTSASNELLSPESFLLNQNFPNPFNPETKISWQTPIQTLQTLKVYDILGKEVATLLNEEKPAGRYEVSFEGNHLSSGVYFYQLCAGNFINTKKMILLR
ncbi:MAG: phosphodiester glycosidase family protein [Ignavibacteriaceae bacterium]|nr:phosphodiester glycosidase family protein [Ignavibacteriaceae bacterium]